MSDKIVRTLSQPSNRANPKDAKEKKVVFKGVLDNPFRILWPSIPVNLQNSIFAYLTERLQGASDYHFHRCALSRKRKRASNTQEQPATHKKARVQPEILQSSSDTHNGAAILLPSTPRQDAKEAVVEPPVLSQHLTCGINEVTKKLELQTQNARRTTIGSVSTPPPPPLKYVFVCRADVDPALLIDHLPNLVAAHNSNCLGYPIKLITLPKGSELVLAHTLGIRRVTVLAVDNAFQDQQLTTMLEQIPILAASWLAKPSAGTPTSLVATHIKHLRTTAPRDMKSAKEKRIQEKADVKKKRMLEKKKGKTI